MSGFGGGTFVLTSADVATALPLPANADLVAVYVNLGTAGSTASTVTVNKNGASAGAVVTVAASATKGDLVIVNPNVGVNEGDLPVGWTDQNEATDGPFNSTGGVTDPPPLASYNAGDTLSLTTALGTSAANPNVALLFSQR